jgi:hypothetical protein
MQKIEINFIGKPFRRESFYNTKMQSINKKIAKLFLKTPVIINLYLYKNQKSFFQAIKKPQGPNWLIGYVSKNNIFLVDTKDEKKFSELLIHEVTHIYINLINKDLPQWAKEGLAVYIAKQISHKKISETNWKNIIKNGSPFEQTDWRKAAKYDGYNIAGLLIMFFLKQYGWNNMNKFLTSYKRKTEFSRSAVDYFGDDYDNLMRKFRRYYVKTGNA